MRRSCCRGASRRRPSCAGRRSGGDRSCEGAREHLSDDVRRKTAPRIPDRGDSFFFLKEVVIGVALFDLLLFFFQRPHPLLSLLSSPSESKRPLSLALLLITDCTFSLSPPLCVVCLAKILKGENTDQNSPVPLSPIKKSLGVRNQNCSTKKKRVGQIKITARSQSRFSLSGF